MKKARVHDGLVSLALLSCYFAVYDSSSLALDDLIESDHIRKRFTGATLYAHCNSNQKWYYLSRQRPDEALIMKIFDS